MHDEALDLAMTIDSAGSHLVWYGRALALTLAGLFLTWLGPNLTDLVGPCPGRTGFGRFLALASRIALAGLIWTWLYIIPA